MSRLQKQVCGLMEEVSCLSAENQRLKQQVLVLGEVTIHFLTEKQQLKHSGQDPGEVKSPLPVEFPKVEQQDHNQDEVSCLSAENRSLKQKSPDPEEWTSCLSAENQWWKRQIHVLWEVSFHFSTENQQLRQPGQDPGEVKFPLPFEFPKVEQQDGDQDEGARLSAENQKLKELVDVLADVVSHNLSENKQLKLQRPDREEPVSRLKQEGPLRDRPGASGALQTVKKTLFASVASPSLGRTSGEDFCVQFRTSGKTDGCEEKFLKDVSKHPSRKGVSLKVKDFRKTSKDLLLLFCPIASRMGTDIENALEGLSGKQKILLVVMHFIPKDNPGPFVDAQHRVTHPAVVRTVHTRFTLKDGFYPCKMNEMAVAGVAAALKALAEDQ
nr:uncharacterized protein LOC110090542 [Pogona vitticeps]